MILPGHIKVYAGASQADGTVSPGRLIITARERVDAIRFCARTGGCYVLVGPNGGRMIYNKSNSKRLDYANTSETEIPSDEGYDAPSIASLR